MPIDVQALGCDFFVFSGHKLFGPTGIGVLWGKRAYLEAMPYYQSGGDMIEQVDFEGTTYKPIPSKFEAGTPHIAGVIGLGAAIDYLNGLDRMGALQHETDLLVYATEQLGSIEGLQIWGQAPDKASVLSFTIDGIHPHDMSTFLNADGIAIRAGHHCTQPLLKRFGLPATARASFSFYNTFAEVGSIAGWDFEIKTIFSLVRCLQSVICINPLFWSIASGLSTMVLYRRQLTVRKAIIHSVVTMWRFFCS